MAMIWTINRMFVVWYRVNRQPNHLESEQTFTEMAFENLRQEENAGYKHFLIFHDLSYSSKDKSNFQKSNVISCLE